MDYGTAINGDYVQLPKKIGKLHNVLPLWGNESTMNLNPLILANIQGSSYFKVSLFKLKTYHEVVDEIYYQVKHLEPWERGSRKTAGQTGMCGGVRGVGAGGIVSSAYCLLYKLYTLRLTRKQLNGLLTHTDSPYIRALGFMYIRYTQPPADLYDWYEEYLQDEEEVDVKAGGGQNMQIGQMLYQWLVKLDWFSTLFPRIPVPIQKQIESKLAEYAHDYNINFQTRHLPQDRIDIGNSGGGGGGNNTNSNNGKNRYNKDSRDYYDNRNRDRYQGKPTTSYRENRSRSREYRRDYVDDRTDVRKDYNDGRDHRKDQHDDRQNYKMYYNDRDSRKDSYNNSERDNRKYRNNDREYVRKDREHHRDYDRSSSSNKKYSNSRRSRSRSNSRNRDRNSRRYD